MPIYRNDKGRWGWRCSCMGYRTVVGGFDTAAELKQAWDEHQALQCHQRFIIRKADEAQRYTAWADRLSSQP